jgi:multiple sugar transport system permease protein/sn-glycerol 3-phosphate transport system permease protein
VSRPIALGRAQHRPRVLLREWGLFLALVAPNLIFLLAFTYWPLIYNGYLSLVEWDMISPEKTFVGLENYRDLAMTPAFWRIVANTFYFVIAGVAITMALALAVALLLNLKLRGRGVARTVVFAPTVLTGSAIAIVWIYILDPNYGLLRVFINAVGLPSPKWLTDLFWAMPALLIVYVWKNFGYAVVVYLAGLQSIPKEIYEAAIVDGASPWDRFRHVTWPGLGPISFFLLVTSILNSFQAFDVVAVMTKGGPVNATNTLIYHLYEEGFLAFHAGRAAAIGVILFVLMLAVTLIQLRGVERKVHYG